MVKTTRRTTEAKVAMERALKEGMVEVAMVTMKRITIMEVDLVAMTMREIMVEKVGMVDMVTTGMGTIRDSGITW